MAWNPIQVSFPRAYEGLAEAALSALDSNQRNSLAKAEFENRKQRQVQADKDQQEALFRAAYDDAIQGYHAGKYTEDEVRGKLQALGAQFGGAQQAQPQPPANPLMRAVAAQQTQRRPIAPVASEPTGPSANDALNAAITAKTLDPRQAGPTQPPMMPTPGVSGPPSPQPAAPQQDAPQAPPANPLVRAAQASQAQDQARAGALRFRRNGQDYSIASRDEMLAAQKHEKEAAIQDQLAKFDAAVAESDDSRLKQNAASIRAMIRSGEDIRAQDVFSMMGKEAAQESQDKRQAERLAQQMKLETEVKEPGRNARTDMASGRHLQGTLAIAGAMRANAGWREAQGAQRIAMTKEALNERMANDYLRNTKFGKQVEQGMALGQTLRGLSGEADAEHALQTKDAQVSLAKFFRGGVPSEGEMAFLYKGIGGLPDKGAQLISELSSGQLSDLQRRNLENAAKAAKAEHSHLANETLSGYGKRFQNSPDKPFFRDYAAGHFKALGLDVGEDFLPDAPSNPLQRASAAGKAQNKFAAAKVDGRLATLNQALASEKDPARKARIQQAISAIESGGK